MSVEDDIAKSIDRLMTEDAESLFGSMMTNVPESNKDLSIEELMKTAELFETHAQAWARDREACIKDDREKGRGSLVLNPENEGVSAMHGNITERDGVEYRVMIDECMRGMRDKDGGIRSGYWVDPLPPLDLMPLIPLPPFETFDIPNEYKYGFRIPTQLRYPQAQIMDVVDLGPTPMDIVSAELPVATVREQKRILVYCWKASRLGISLKAYARGSKMGRAWLNRKKR